MINIADRLYDQKMKTRLLPVIYAVNVHVDWSALQMGSYLCIACHAVQWRGKKNCRMMQCTCTRKEGDRTHVRSDKGALHVDTISDITFGRHSTNMHGREGHCHSQCLRNTSSRNWLVNCSVFLAILLLLLFAYPYYI